MNLTADLHIHSHYSRATSKDLDGWMRTRDKGPTTDPKDAS